MTKECRNPNSESDAFLRADAFRISSFGFLSDFVIRISDFSVGFRISLLLHGLCPRRCAVRERTHADWIVPAARGKSYFDREQPHRVLVGIDSPRLVAQSPAELVNSLADRAVLDGRTPV